VSDHDEDELEQALRAVLADRAGHADVDAQALERVMPRRRPRHGRGAAAAVIALAAASVVAVAGAATVLSRAGDERPSKGTSAYDDAVAAEPWRVEAWGDVQVEVPADWGYGGGPNEDGLACYPEAILDASGQPLRSGAEDRGYVGRPFSMTDECSSLEAGGPFAGPYVWFGADLEPGAVEREGGLVQETIEVAGTTVTVGAVDDSLRSRILGSVTGSESCLSELPRSGPIEHDRAADPDAAPATLRVCTYRLADTTGGAGAWELTSATDLDAAALNAYLAAVAAGDPLRDQCPTIDYQLSEAAVLEILDEQGQVLRQDAVNTFDACAGIAVDADRVWPLETTALTPEMARPWVVGGVGAVLYGDPDLGFIGPQG
jgi:hypothetical protein